MAEASALVRQLLPAGALPRPCERDITLGKQLRLFVYPLPWAYNGQVVEYVEQRARELLHVKCQYLREDSCPNQGFSHLENLRSHCTDVPLMAKLLQVSECRARRRRVREEWQSGGGEQSAYANEPSGALFLTLTLTLTLTHTHTIALTRALALVLALTFTLTLSLSPSGGHHCARA